MDITMKKKVDKTVIVYCKSGKMTLNIQDCNTYHSNNPNDFVASIYDTRNNISAPIGTDWGISLSSGGKISKPSDWTMGNLGRIFGIAVDNSSNIYFASSGVYNQYINSGAGLVPYVNANPGRIYKATAGSSYSISTLVDLPVTSSVGSLSGIGNIAYDKINNQLFATNLDNGKIYRIKRNNREVFRAKFLIVSLQQERDA